LCVGHLWLHSEPPKLHRWSDYRNHLILRKLDCTLSLMHMYSSECTDRLLSWKADTVHCPHFTLSMIRDFKYSNGSVATRQFLSVVHTCGEGWNLSGQMVFQLMTGFWTVCTQKLHNSLRRPTYGNRIYTYTNITLNVRLWSRYGVMTTYNIIPTCRFHENVADCN